MKKLLHLLLISCLCLSLVAGCSKKQPETTDKTEDPVTIRISALSGPTAMGMVKLMEDAKNNATEGSYAFGELSSDASAFVPAISKGELDICAVPANLAANLYNKTNGNVIVLAANVYNVLNIVQRGEETLSSLADLKGKTIYATGQGAIPECILRYLLDKNGINPDQDVTIQWCAEPKEALSLLSANENSIAMLPQPFVTAACAQIEDLKIAFDLGEEWAKINPDNKIITGCLVISKEFANTHPQAVATFLKEYEASVHYTLNQPEEAAALIAEAGIVNAPALAQKALPGCNITFLAGEQLQTQLSAFLEIIAEYNSALIGNQLPGEDFYYDAK